jgi:hypothetical protein
VSSFCVRASAADDLFTVDDADAAIAAAICEELDGLPLAIELAAAHVVSLGLAELLTHIKGRLRILHTRDARAVDRHRTLLATVAWSYDLLNEPEKALFDRLSVFRGGFDLTASEAVCRDDATPADIVESLRDLVDKSMVVARRAASGTRYHVLEPLRQFGEERLSERGETPLIRSRHAQHYTQVATRANVLWTSPREQEANEMVERDWDNLRAAHSWALDVGALDIADTVVATTAPYATSHLVHEHGDWAVANLGLGNATRRASPSSSAWAAYWAYIRGDLDEAAALARQGIGTDESADLAQCWSVLALAQSAAGQREEALRSAERAAVTGFASDDLYAQAAARNLVLEAGFEGDIESVRPAADAYGEWAASIGAPSLVASAAFYQGRERLWLRSPPTPTVPSTSMNSDCERPVGSAMSAWKAPTCSAKCSPKPICIHLRPRTFAVMPSRGSTTPGSGPHTGSLSLLRRCGSPPLIGKKRRSSSRATSTCTSPHGTQLNAG